MDHLFPGAFARTFGRKLLMEGDNGAGSGGGTLPPAPTPPAAGGGTPNPLAGVPGMNLPVEVLRALSQQAEGSGGWQAYAVALADQNQKLRTKIRTLANAPTDALVITDKDEKDVISSLKGKLGSIKAIGDRVAVADRLEGEVATAKRTAALTEAADAAGLKGKVLAQLPGMDALETEVRTVGEGAAAKKVAYVKITKGEGASATTETVELLGLVKEKYPDLMPALVATPADDSQPALDANGQPQQQQGIPTHTQQPYNPATQFSVAAPPATGGGGQQVDLLSTVLGPINEANKTVVKAA